MKIKFFKLSVLVYYLSTDMIQVTYSSHEKLNLQGYSKINLWVATKHKRKQRKYFSTWKCYVSIFVFHFQKIAAHMLVILLLLTFKFLVRALVANACMLWSTENQFFFVSANQRLILD